MRVHINHHGLYSMACFFSALSASLRPAAARRQHTLLGWQLDGRRTTIQTAVVRRCGAPDLNHHDMPGCDFSGEVSYHRWWFKPYSRYLVDVSRTSDRGDSPNIIFCGFTDHSRVAARAASGHVAAALLPRKVMTSRRFIR
jgi:hypothetical protein